MNVISQGHQVAADLIAASITHEDLTETAANTAQVIDLIDVEAGDILEALWVDNATPLQDDSDAAFNTTVLTVGDADDADRFLTSAELNVNGTEVLGKMGLGMPYMFPEAKTIKATIGSMAAKSLVNIDTGEFKIFFRLLKTKNL